MTGDTSVDAHHAGNAVTDRTSVPGACGSIDAHHAADAFTDTTLALMSYNIGINNNEVDAKGWKNKYMKLQDDVKSAFTHEAGIQVLLICEFGNMLVSIDSALCSGVTQPTGRTIKCTRELFEDLLADINMQNISVVADPPYVALIDSDCWEVKHRGVLVNLCTKRDIKVQHLILQHANTSET